MSITDTRSETIRAEGEVVKRLGAWTTGRRFRVTARRAVVVLDLLLPQLEPGVVEISLDADRAMVKLLVPDGTRIETDDLHRRGRGRVKDWSGAAAAGGRIVRLTGELRDSEVRVHRGGIAILSLLRTREHRREVRTAHREGRL